MLEIFILYILCKNIGRILAAKGRAKLPFQLLLILLWFGAEIGGTVIGMVIEVIVRGEPEPSIGPAYLCGIGGAAVSAFILFQIAKALPSVIISEPTEDEYQRYWQEAGDARDVNRRIPSDNDGIAEGQLPNPSQPDDRFRG